MKSSIITLPYKEFKEFERYKELMNQYKNGSTYVVLNYRGNIVSVKTENEIIQKLTEENETLKKSRDTLKDENNNMTSMIKHLLTVNFFQFRNWKKLAWEIINRT